MNGKSRGKAITEESFKIIKSRLQDFHAPREVLEIVVRIAHTTGDVQFGMDHHIPPDSVINGVQALKKGCSIITDVEMVRTGIRAAMAETLGCKVLCFLNDSQVVEASKRTGETRSELGMAHAADALNGAVVAIGNAPTALFKLLSMIENGEVSPALVIGVPVGFVGALDSKQALYESGHPCITNLSERGGSPIAAAVVNGLLHLASVGPAGEDGSSETETKS